MQITKAMELVATSKLRKAKERVECSRPYFEALGQSIGCLLAVRENDDSPYLKNNDGGKDLYIVIAGDRGLAGGYNNNVFRFVRELTAQKDFRVLPIGKKAAEHYKHTGENLSGESIIHAATVGVGKARELARIICDGFLAGNYNRVSLVYTRFASMLSQIPVCEPLLPIPEKNKPTSPPVFDDDFNEMLGRMVPDYISGMIYAAVCESIASESAARRGAMNAANKNAGEMIDNLMLNYNRARQGQITQEITEIVSGAEAL